MDEDLDSLSREELIAQVKQLRARMASVYARLHFANGACARRACGGHASTRSIHAKSMASVEMAISISRRGEPIHIGSRTGYYGFS
jgi:hypothetical protein